MKKVISVIAIIAILCTTLFILTGCGEDDTSENGKDNNNSTSENGKNNSNSLDTNTPEGRLAKAGLKLEDIKPENFDSMENDPGSGEEGVYLFLEKGANTYDITASDQPVRKNFYDNLYDAIAATSEDGKVYDMYYGFGETKEAIKPSENTESNFNAMIFMVTWSYKKDGNWVTVIATDTSAEKEDGESHPVFMLSLSYSEY